MQFTRFLMVFKASGGVLIGFDAFWEVFDGFV